MKKVCMIVQDKAVKGGIAAVISGYYGSRLEKDYKMIDQMKNEYVPNPVCLQVIPL